MQSVVGIDFGLTGALALYRDGDWLLLYMPIVGDAKHREPNGPELYRWLREHQPDHAFVEYASARPGQGVVSMFHYGATKMALAVCGIPFTIITPVKWKSIVGITAGADKEQSRARALQLFPSQAANLIRRKDHARAEAMLLAWCGIQMRTEILAKAGIQAGGIPGSNGDRGGPTQCLTFS